MPEVRAPNVSVIDLPQKLWYTNGISMGKNRLADTLHMDTNKTSLNITRGTIMVPVYLRYRLLHSAMEKSFF